MTLDPRAYARERIAASGARPAMNDAAAQRAAIRQVIGGLDAWERPPLNATVSDTVSLDGYRRETIRFTSRPGLDVFAYFLVPDVIDAPRPAVVCLPGHGRGVDSLVGIGADGTQRRLGDRGEYQADFALQCVGEGYPTLAVEQISFGHRRDERARASGPEASSCHEDSVAALMLGESIIGWRVWDAMRALDYLETRSEVVDAARLVTMGISGGGLTSLFTGALDTRVACCVVSGYLNTFADSVLSIRHCVDNYASGLLTLCEMPDLACLVAPRLLCAESGRDDPIFPVAAFERAVGQIREHYTAAGVPQNFTADVFEGGHRFDGTGVWPLLRGRLSASA